MVLWGPVTNGWPHRIHRKSVGGVEGDEDIALAIFGVTHRDRRRPRRRAIRNRQLTTPGVAGELQFGELEGFAVDESGHRRMDGRIDACMGVADLESEAHSLPEANLRPIQRQVGDLRCNGIDDKGLLASKGRTPEADIFGLHRPEVGATLQTIDASGQGVTGVGFRQGRVSGDHVVATRGGAHTQAVCQTRRWRIAVVGTGKPAKEDGAAGIFGVQARRGQGRDVGIGLLRRQIVVDHRRRRLRQGTARGDEVKVTVAVGIGHGDGAEVDAGQNRHVDELEKRIGCTLADGIFPDLQDRRRPVVAGHDQVEILVVVVIRPRQVAASNPRKCGLRGGKGAEAIVVQQVRDIVVGVVNAGEDDIEVTIAVIIAQGDVARLTAVDPGAHVYQPIGKVVAVEVDAAFTTGADTGLHEVEVTVTIGVAQYEVTIVETFEPIVTLHEGAIRLIGPDPGVGLLHTIVDVSTPTSVDEVEIAIEIDVAPGDGGGIEVEWKAQRCRKIQRVIRNNGDIVEEIGSIALGDATRGEQVEIAIVVIVTPGNVTLGQGGETGTGVQIELSRTIDVNKSLRFATSIGAHQDEIVVTISVGVAPCHGGICHAAQTLIGGDELADVEMTLGGEVGSSQGAIDGLHTPVIRIRRQGPVEDVTRLVTDTPILHGALGGEDVTRPRFAAEAQVVRQDR